MTPDDWIYATLLLFSVPLGFVIRSLPGSLHKQVVSSGIGVLMISIVCGIHGLHSLLTAIINSLIVVYINPKICHFVSFAWCFGYIAFFRTTVYFGLPQVHPHANAVQLLLTLKMVGMAVEVHDTDKYEQICKEEGTEKKVLLRHKFQKIHPSFLDTLFYSYCYIGLLTGPYYKYRTWHDMIHNEKADTVDIWTPLKERIKWLPVTAVGFLIISNIFTIEYVHTDEFFENPFWYRLLYMMPMFFVFRLRLYSAWIASECVCFTAALGAYPKDSKPKCGQGPTDYEVLEKVEEEDQEIVEHDFETIHNISIYGCELATTLRDGMRSWNMTVQFWLASNIYRRVPIKVGSIRVAVTMIVSAYWHGIYGGYYLSFLLVPLSLITEDLLIAAFRKNASPAGQKAFDWFNLFYKMRSFDYMCMGFLLLSWKSTMRYWGSIYYLGHVWVLVLGIIAYVWKLLFISSRHEKSPVQQNDNDKKKE